MGCIIQSTGKSHVGYVIVLDEAGVLSARSSEQKIESKSSIEVELDGLSDSTTRAISLENFVEKQGYSGGPVLIY
jgi:hypothetical protein